MVYNSFKNNIYKKHNRSKRQNKHKISKRQNKHKISKKYKMFNKYRLFRRKKTYKKMYGGNILCRAEDLVANFVNSGLGYSKVDNC